MWRCPSAAAAQSAVGAVLPAVPRHLLVRGEHGGGAVPLQLRASEVPRPLFPLTRSRRLTRSGGGSVMAIPAVTLSPTASMSRLMRPVRQRLQLPFLQLARRRCTRQPSAADTVVYLPPCSMMVAPHGGQVALVSPPGQPQPVNMNPQESVGRQLRPVRDLQSG